jgi:hypothetical protein
LTTQNQHENSDQILLDAIDEALSSLGEDVKTSTVFHLENQFKIKKKEFPHRIDDSQEALEQIFGLGTRYLEILIIKSLHSKLKLICEKSTPEWVVPELTFKEYVRMMKQNFE